MPGSGKMTITVDADGVSRVYTYSKAISVGQFLQEIGISLGPDDEVNPMAQSQIRDGMRVTVTRVVYQDECENEILPFEVTHTLSNEGLAPGEERIIQVGKTGLQQICYRTTYRNGVEAGRTQIGSPLVIEPAQEQIIAVGSEAPDTLIPIEGVLIYISNGQAFKIEANTINRTPLTQGSFLDGRVFDTSADGGQLLYTVRTADETDPEFSNELWAVLDTSANQPEATQLAPSDVRYAQWVPGQQTYTVSYSTATPTSTGAGWQALNDLYIMQLDPEEGTIIGVPERVIAPNGLGAYAYWGRRFLWSPDGTKLAWANAASVGLVEMEKGHLTALLTFTEYATLLVRSVVWVPTLSWSDDNSLITILHGPPYSDEPAEESIIFDIAVTNVDSRLQITDFIPKSGIWANPTYSPEIESAGGSTTMFAYFQAREPLNSPGTEYDLWVADSDGSNPRLVFPGLDKPGFRPPDPEDGIAWSPKARQIAVIYQGNLWIIDVKSGLSHQITSDGKASRPRWSRR